MNYIWTNTIEQPFHDISSTRSGKLTSNGLVLVAGQVGSWKADFTVEQNEIADEWIRNGRKGLEDIKLIFEWFDIDKWLIWIGRKAVTVK